MGNNVQKQDTTTVASPVTSPQSPVSFIKEKGPIKKKSKDRLIAKRYRLMERKTLGTGTYAVVKLGIDLQRTNKKVAVKIMHKTKAQMRPGDYERILKEIEIHPTLHHQNIVECVGWHEESDEIYIIEEYIKGGDLLELLVKRDYQPFKESEAKFYFAQLVNGIEYLHRNGFVHRDIKMENILFDNESNCLKLCDFGFADRIPADKLFRNFPGTLAYAPPEVLKGLPHDGPARDIWSLGVLLWLFLAGEYPLGQKKSDITKLRIIEEEPNWHRLNCSSQARDLLQRLLNKDPKQRLTAQQILNHPWLASVSQSPLTGFVPPLKAQASFSQASPLTRAKHMLKEPKQMGVHPNIPMIKRDSMVIGS